MVLGTKPILLSPFSSGGQRHVFAASDRPTIIYSNNKKLLYSNLNENDVAYLASFSTSSLPDSLALVKANYLSLGTIDGEHCRCLMLTPNHHLVAGCLTVVDVGQGTQGVNNTDSYIGPQRLLWDKSVATMSHYFVVGTDEVCSLSPDVCRYPEAAHQDCPPRGAAPPHLPPVIHQDTGCGHHQCSSLRAWTCR